MDKKTVIALVVLVAVVVLGAILIAAPKPNEGNNDIPPPYTSDVIKLDVLGSGSAVLPNFTITGEARGTWFFEASFPIEVVDNLDNVIGGGIAQATEDWMTENFVSFAADIKTSGYSGPATLILKKDNPSGLPENDASVLIPITIQ